MDYFNDVLTTFLGLERDSCIAVYGGFAVFDLIKNTGLKRHAGEQLMTEFSFLGELSL